MWVKKEGRETEDITSIDIPILALGGLRIRTFRKNLPPKTFLLTNDVERIRFCQDSFHCSMQPTIQNVRDARVLIFLTDENLEVICEVIAQFLIMIEMDSALASYTLRLMKIY